MPRLCSTKRSRPVPVTAAACAALLLAVGGGDASAQLREIAASRIGVSDREASLHLELAGDEELEVTFDEGVIRVDGRDQGDYERGGRLDRAWRGLLSEAVLLDGGPLARALVEWTPPEELEDDARNLATRIDELLEGRLSTQAPSASDELPLPAESLSVALDLEALDALLREDRLEALRRVVADLPEGSVQIRDGGEITLGPDERIEGSLIVVGGDVEVQGELAGDLIVIDGTARVAQGGRIGGSVRLIDARLASDEGTIGGQVREISVPRSVPAGARESLREQIEAELGDVEELRERIRREVRSELRDELRRDFRREDRGFGELFTSLAPLGNLIGGLAGLLQNVVGFFLLGLLGVAAFRFFPEELDVVAEAARSRPGRSAAVGLAGAFLVLPVWILGMLVLAVSIVGIPALLAWIPLFPLAAVVAAGFGYLAVAAIVGEWVARQGFPKLEFLRPSNAIHTLGAGIGFFLLPFVVANVARMGGQWFELLRGLFLTVGWTGAVGATFVGLGSVLLTRGGRRSLWRWRPPYTDPVGGRDPTRAGAAEPSGDDLSFEDAGKASPFADRTREPGSGDSGERDEGEPGPGRSSAQPEHDGDSEQGGDDGGEGPRPGAGTDGR